MLTTGRLSEAPSSECQYNGRTHSSRHSLEGASDNRSRKKGREQGWKKRRFLKKSFTFLVFLNFSVQISLRLDTHFDPGRTFFTPFSVWHRFLKIRTKHARKHESKYDSSVQNL